MRFSAIEYCKFDRAFPNHSTGYIDVLVVFLEVNSHVESMGYDDT